jgi:hypothetical protein
MRLSHFIFYHLGNYAKKVDPSKSAGKARPGIKRSEYILTIEFSQ